MQIFTDTAKCISMWGRKKIEIQYNELLHFSGQLFDISVVRCMTKLRIYMVSNVYGWIMCTKKRIGQLLFAAAFLIPVSSCSPWNVRDFISNLK